MKKQDSSFGIVKGLTNRLTGAEPGFPIGGGATLWGAPTYGFAKFSQKLHGIEKILGHRGRMPEAPPPRSTTG